MVLKREQALKTITDGLGWVVAQAQLRAAIHLFDANTLVHELFRRLLNEMHGLELVATDRIRANFPAIDLADETRKRSYQVTTEKDTAKIQATLDTFDRHGLPAQFGKLQVIIIGDRQKSYTGLKVPPGVQFAWENDIIDTPRLVKEIEALPIDKQERLASIVRSEIGLLGEREPHDWKAFQGGSISSCSFLTPLRLLPGSDEVDPAFVEAFKACLHQWIALAFGHTCLTTPFDDFVYLLSLERIDDEPRHGVAPFELSFLCHITEFVWALQKWSLFFLDAEKDWKVRSRIKGFTGDQVLRGDSLLGDLVPHRIRRLPPAEILLEPLVGRPKPYDQRVTTSTLLHLTANALTTKLVVWDDADKSPDLMKVLSMGARISDRRRFSWGEIKLDRTNPESWEYDG